MSTGGKHPLARDPNASPSPFWFGVCILFGMVLLARWMRPPAPVPVDTLGRPITNVSMPVSAHAPAALEQSGQPMGVRREGHRLPVPIIGAKAPRVTPAQFPDPQSVPRTLPRWLRFTRSGGPINAVFSTPDGVVWAGGEDGLMRIEGETVSVLNGFPGINVTCFTHDGQHLWIGTFDGLYQSTDGSSFRRYGKNEGLGSDLIWSLHWDSTMLWVGTQGGFSFLTDGESFQTVTREISGGGLGDLWIGGIIRVGTYLLAGNDDGLSIWNTESPAVDSRAWKTLDIFDTNLIHNWVLALVEGPQGIWMGTPWGLTRLITPLDHVMAGTQGVWENFTVRDGLPHDRVNAVLPVGEDLWVGTEGGLAHRSHGTWQACTVRDGLLHPQVRGLHATDSLLWVGTAGGLQAIDMRLIPSPR